MSKSVRGRGLAVVIALLLPLVIVGLQHIAIQPSVWIVYADTQDASIDLASITLSDEMISAGYIVKEMSFMEIDRIPLYSDAIVLIGHGQVEGLEVLDTILPWTLVNDVLEERESQMVMLLTCNSPSEPESGIFGFPGQIDARAGALLTAWKILQTLAPRQQANIPLELAVDAQMKMEHPLESYVYFLHGYYGSNSDFDFMRDYLEPFIGSRYSAGTIENYSYFEDYPGLPEEWVHTFVGGVSTYSENFYNRLMNNHTAGTQIDIVAHSIGGIIIREMLRLHRADLESAGIEIGRVVTLGTPHYGTEMACANLGAFAITVLLSLFGDCWLTPVFLQMHPYSPLIMILNADPESYMSGIEWYSISGYDWLIGNLLYMGGILNGPNDQLVTMSSASVPLASGTEYINGTHAMLVSDGPSGASYPLVNDWLGGGIDTDTDGIIDVEERYIYYTDPYDSDSDNDALSDYDEIFVHETNPNAWSTDGDILSDSQEIAWGYDPNNTYDPINAQELTYSAWQVNGVTGYVRANHYAAMDYVKVYVQYKNSLGYWTAYFYVGTDYTPSYYGDYYVEWSLLQGYVQMQVNVQAYAIEWDPAIEQDVHIYLGSDQQYVTLPGGGGGKPGGDPVPE